MGVAAIFTLIDESRTELQLSYTSNLSLIVQYGFGKPLLTEITRI